jgi:hypothetical protein
MAGSLPGSLSASVRGVNINSPWTGIGRTNVDAARIGSRSDVGCACEYDLPALFTALAPLSQFAAVHADGVESVDINPFLVLPEGQGAVALDALIIRR